MRLPSWFAVGAELADVAGFQVGCVQRGETWSSHAAPSDFALTQRVVDVSQGRDLAVRLSVTTGLAEDVLSYIRLVELPVKTYFDLAPESGESDHALGDASAARGWGLAVRDAVRGAARSSGAEKVHLFISGPAGAALLLGHVWNRMPVTQVYADTSLGYLPAYRLPG